MVDVRPTIEQHGHEIESLKIQIQRLSQQQNETTALLEVCQETGISAHQKIIGIQNEFQLFMSTSYQQFKDLAQMKESDFQTRVSILKNELQSMQDNIGRRFEDRIAVLESMQEQRASGFTQLLEAFEAQQTENHNSLQARVFAHVDRNTLDALQRSQDHTNEIMKSARADTESMLKRLGANMQTALEKVQTIGL